MKIISYLLNWSYITCVIIIFCGVTQPPVFVLINLLTPSHYRIASNYCQIIECCRDLGFLRELEHPLGEEMVPEVLGSLGYTACGVFK